MADSIMDVDGFRKITAEHEPQMSRFLEDRVGTGCWGCRIENGTLTLKVLPRWADAISAALDHGNFIYRVTRPARHTGITSIAVLAQYANHRTRK